MKQYATKYTVFSVIPIILLFGYFFSAVRIRFIYLIGFGFILLIGFISLSLKCNKNNIIRLFFIYFIWATFLFLWRDNQYKFVVFRSILCSAYMMVGMYYYSLYSNSEKFILYICTFIAVSFFIAFLEVNFNLILPLSGKTLNERYAREFKNIPVNTFTNPNDFATSIGMVFIYAYAYLKIMKRKLCYFVLFCSLYIIWFTGSRGVQITVILFPVIFSLVNRKPLIKLLFIYFFAVIFFYFLSIGGYISSYNLGKYTRSINALASGQLDASSMARWEMIIYTFMHLKELMIGYGPGGSQIFLGIFPIPNPHNFFIEVLIDYGFVGLILIICVFILTLKKNYWLLNKNIPGFIRASCKATIVLTYLYIIFAAVSSSLFINWPYAWLPIYLTLYNLGSYKREITLRKTIEGLVKT